jgi:CopA family copper-resistance protein
MRKLLLISLLLFFRLHLVAQKIVRFDLFVADTLVNYSGKAKHAIAINGQIPAPTLTFTEGDTAEIYVHNMLDVGTSVHWHGIFLPNQFDGVPYLTQMPIKPRETHLYKFPVIQNGTYWYHSHSGLQEQSGMYGALIFLKRNPPPKELGKGENSIFRKGIDDLPTLPVVLSDWTDINPNEVDRSLHNATDWFAIKKHSTQSYSEAISSGNFKTKLTNEWKRMNAMDVSDVAYNNFLINGKNESQLSQYKGGDKIRLQIINAGASSYFWLSWAGGKITVVANDGNDLEPVEVDRLLIAAAETYDIIITIPDNMNYELLATPEDRTSSASLWFGSGMKMQAVHLPKLKYFEGMKMMNSMMQMNGNMEPMGMQMSNQTMDMNAVMYPEITGEKKSKKKKHQQHNMSNMDMQNMNDTTQNKIITLNYSMLKATEKTTLASDSTRTLNFTLTGNMNRYVWSLDNKVVSEADKILIHKGENIRIILYNNTMMRHPMHLHGHDFRVLNGQGDYAPLKNVLDIMPMETDTIEFAPTEQNGDWFFHCHILYHMMSGMGRIFSYQNSPPNPELPDPKSAQRKLFSTDREFHFMAKAGIESNGTDGEAMFANTRFKFEEMWHMGYHAEHGFESETMIGRYFGKMQWWYPYIGFDYHYKKEGTPQANFFDMMHSPKNIFGNETKTMFGQTNDKNNRHTGVIGIAYTLPTLTIADFRLAFNGKIRFQLSREGIPLTPRFRMNWMLNTDKEYVLGFRYIATKYISVSTHYDSDMGFGAGLTFTY